MMNRRITFQFPYRRYFKLPIYRALDRSIFFMRERIDVIVEATRR